MSTGYGREGLRQVCATLLGARHVPERLFGGLMPTWGAITNVHLYLFIELLCYVAGDAVTVADSATPHYNSWILSDLTAPIQHRHIDDALGDGRSLRDGIMLLKVWLHQRQLDVVCKEHVLICFYCIVYEQIKLNSSVNESTN